MHHKRKQQKTWKAADETVDLLVIWDVMTLMSHQCTLLWRHCGRDGVSNHQPREYLLNCSFRCRSKKTSKLCVTGLCAGNSPVTGEFPAQMASNAETVSIWWRHHEIFSAPTYSPDCGVPAIPPAVRSRIVGGVRATPHSWPWQVRNPAW